MLGGAPTPTRPALTLSRQADAEKAALLAKLDELTAAVEQRDSTLQQAAQRIREHGGHPITPAPGFTAPPAYPAGTLLRGFQPCDGARPSPVDDDCVGCPRAHRGEGGAASSDIGVRRHPSGAERERPNGEPAATPTFTAPGKPTHRQ
jgi:hypothetical protein